MIPTTFLTVFVDKNNSLIFLYYLILDCRGFNENKGSRLYNTASNLCRGWLWIKLMSLLLVLAHLV